MAMATKPLLRPCRCKLQLRHRRHHRLSATAKPGASPAAPTLRMFPLGQMVVIFGDAKTEPGQLDLDYSWSTDGGAIEGSGNTGLH